MEKAAAGAVCGFETGLDSVEELDDFIDAGNDATLLGERWERDGQVLQLLLADDGEGHGDYLDESRRKPQLEACASAA